jgi:DNA-binding CsgD family transcriptional regulator
MTSVEARVLALVAEVIGLTTLVEFRLGLLEALRTAVPSDYASLNHIGPGAEVIAVAMIPDAPREMYATFARLAHENPLVQRHARTLDGRAYRFSDVISQRELHELALYREFYAPLRVEHQLAFTLPARQSHILGIALSREAPDYTREDCELVNLARPFLIQAFRNAVEHDRPRAAGASDEGRGMAAGLREAGLTDREAEVVCVLAHGGSNADIGAVLGVSVRTVQKHLERAFRKLGVADRYEAAARAWQLAERRLSPEEALIPKRIPG